MVSLFFCFFFFNYLFEYIIINSPLLVIEFVVVAGAGGCGGCASVFTLSTQLFHH